MNELNEENVQRWLDHPRAPSSQDVVALCSSWLAQRKEIERYESLVEIEHQIREVFDAPVWQPIATAPRDGSEVLLIVERRACVPYRMLVGHWMPGGYCIEDHPAIDAGWYFWNGCAFDKASKPTHWMPLPDGPNFVNEPNTTEPTR